MMQQRHGQRDRAGTVVRAHGIVVARLPTCLHGTHDEPKAPVLQRPVAAARGRADHQRESAAEGATPRERRGLGDKRRGVPGGGTIDGGALILDALCRLNEQRKRRGRGG